MFTDDVPGDQEAVPRRVQGDTAGGMPWNGQHGRAAREVQHVTLVDLLIDTGGRCGRQVAGHQRVQGTLGVREVRCRADFHASDDRRVRYPRRDRCSAPGGDLRGRACVVIVEMGQDDTPQVLGSQPEFIQRGPNERCTASRAGVDAGDTPITCPKVGVRDTQLKSVQVRKRLKGDHNTTIRPYDQDAAMAACFAHGRLAGSRRLRPCSTVPAGQRMIYSLGACRQRCSVLEHP